MCIIGENPFEKGFSPIIHTRLYRSKAVKPELFIFASFILTM